ncbi:MAG TPA: ATP-binding protein [Acetobacteraceae bacterium]|jgi:two-component sensor histidine kinase|nr:ATP-binding protein [Acetobacteraceae bacterium]
MQPREDINWRGVWTDEAMHRAANLRHLATNLDRLIDSGRIGSSNRYRTIQRANALVSAYQTLDTASDACPRSCVLELRAIAGGLVEIFGHTVGSLALSLDLQPLQLAGEKRRALLLAASELVVNALRHAFVGRQAGSIHIALRHDRARQEGVLVVADDGVGPGGSMDGSGHGCGIIRKLADVLDGDATWRRSAMGGTEASLSFPLTGSRVG